MFSKALSSFASNISSNYTISTSPTSYAGPWKIYDGKKKSTGKEISIFVFDRKSLESQGGGSLGRQSASSLKRATDEVVERLKKEAFSLARLRHPNVLELVEPVEETRSGGLQFATEAVTASLSGLLQEQDEQERAGGFGGRSSRRTDGDASRHRKDIEIDELEIQKGLLQISKALEFLHENAGLVHGNLTPDSIFINAKSDWKISGLSFLSPPENSNKPTSVQPIFLSEVLNIDPRLPKSVQINLDYASPDFVLDNNLNCSADMFSLGLLIVALYNTPHVSPLESHSSITTYKRLFQSSSSIPSATNGYLSARPLPKELAASVLPKLIARRPAQRLTAREFQQSAYFDNILVSTIRFLDSLPEKTPSEKKQFLSGLPRVIPQFPKSVLEKKVLPALLEEMKDRELLALILQSIFKLIQRLSSSKRAFTDRILPRLREIFLPVSSKKDATPERDTAKEAGLMVVLENMNIVADNCTGKEFHDEVLPIIILAIESPTPPLVDAGLRSLPTVLPVLDFSTIKNELFPVIASVFSKTSSLAIKVRGLEAFVILAGGSSEAEASNDGLDGIAVESKKKTPASALDKYTIQEKMVPLIRAIKTKEPAVILAALKVLRQIGSVVDTEYLAMEVLPILWSMSLGPLLNLQQFREFIELIKTLSTRVEVEHTKKLNELGGSNPTSSSTDIMSFGTISAFPSTNGSSDTAEADFERLVHGRVSTSAAAPTDTNAANRPAANPAPTFSWSTPVASQQTTALRPQASMSRTVTPDLSAFTTLSPSSTQFSTPLQPTLKYNPPALQPQQTTPIYQAPAQASSIWNAPPQPPSTTPNPWASPSQPTAPFQSMNNSMKSLSLQQQSQAQRPTMTTSTNSFSLPPPPMSPSYGVGMVPQNNAFKPPQQQQGLQNAAFGGMPNNHGMQGQGQKQGMDKYESLL